MQGRRTWVRLHEKGGNRHEMPCHRELETFLLDYIEDAVRLGWSYMTVGLSEGPSRGLAATLPARSTRRAASIAGKMGSGEKL